MRLRNTISGIWDKAGGLDGRVANSSTSRGSGGIITLRNGLLALGVAAILYNVAEAKTINIDLSNPNDPNTAEINRIIREDSEPNDTIYFMDGEHKIPYGQRIDLLPNRDYVFGIVTISGSSYQEHGNILRIINGGDMNISATDLTLQKSKVGIGIGDDPFKNINITGGIRFIDIYKFHIVYENIKHTPTLKQAAVSIGFCTADGGDKFVMFNEGAEIDANSPYASVRNCTLDNMHSSGGVIDVPIFFRETVTGSGIPAKNGGEWVALGNDEIKDNVLRNVSSLSKPADFWIYHSPEGILQDNVTTPLITGAEYLDWYDNPHIFDGKNCAVIDANWFLPGTDIPKRDSPLNYGNGRFAGSIEPYHELPGNLNFDEYVDFYDFAIAAKRYNGNLEEIADIAKDWLLEEPNDPNGNPKISMITPALK